jgi:uncharacterized protein (TIGR03067 family)
LAACLAGQGPLGWSASAGHDISIDVPKPGQLRQGALADERTEGSLPMRAVFRVGANRRVTRLSHRAQAGDDTKSSPREREVERHQGTWQCTSSEAGGIKAPFEMVISIQRVVKGDHVEWKRDGKNFAGTTVEFDPTTKPKTIDVIPDGGNAKGKRVLGIYKLEGDDLTICMAGVDQDRPKEFDASKGSKRTLMTFKREKR